MYYNLIMIISNRKKKDESDKLVKELLMYTHLVNNNIIYDFFFNEISNTNKRSLQRYAKELYLCGAVPKLRLKSSKNGFYYKTEDLINTNKKFYRFNDDQHSNRLARLVTMVYLKAANHPIASNKAELEKFYFKQLNPGACKKTFTRDLKLVEKTDFLYHQYY